MNRFLCIMGFALGLLQGHCALPPAPDTHPTAESTPTLPKESLLPGAPLEQENPSAAVEPPAAWAAPPLWYWNERQKQDLDRSLQQQREQYYRNRQPAPQFQRPPVCNSTQVGGQVYTHCY